MGVGVIFFVYGGGFTSLLSEHSLETLCLLGVWGGALRFHVRITYPYTMLFPEMGAQYNYADDDGGKDDGGGDDGGYSIQIRARWFGYPALGKVLHVDTDWCY